MQVNLTTNSLNSKPTFQAVVLQSRAEETLRNNLKTNKDIRTFKEIVQTRKDDKYTDLYLFGDGKKLYARIINKEDSTAGIIAEKSQRFWESSIAFLERMSKRTYDTEKKLSTASQRQKLLDEVLENADI